MRKSWSCVVWIDEVEKQLQGATSGSADGGVSADALGAILTWMQERKTPAFIVVTANDAAALPAEFWRKGRFDEVFSIDLPNPDGAREIETRDLIARSISWAAVLTAFRPDSLPANQAEDQPQRCGRLRGLRRGRAGWRDRCMRLPAGHGVRFGPRQGGHRSCRAASRPIDQQAGSRQR